MITRMKNGPFSASPQNYQKYQNQMDSILGILLFGNKYSGKQMNLEAFFNTSNTVNYVIQIWYYIIFFMFVLV